MEWIWILQRVFKFLPRKHVLRIVTRQVHVQRCNVYPCTVTHVTNSQVRQIIIHFHTDIQWCMFMHNKLVYMYNSAPCHLRLLIIGENRAYRQVAVIWMDTISGCSLQTHRISRNALLLFSDLSRHQQLCTIIFYLDLHSIT